MAGGSENRLEKETAPDDHAKAAPFKAASYECTDKHFSNWEQFNELLYILLIT